MRITAAEGIVMSFIAPFLAFTASLQSESPGDYGKEAGNHLKK